MLSFSPQGTVHSFVNVSFFWFGNLLVAQEKPTGTIGGDNLEEAALMLFTRGNEQQKFLTNSTTQMTAHLISCLLAPSLIPITFCDSLGNDLWLSIPVSSKLQFIASCIIKKTHNLVKIGVVPICKWDEALWASREETSSVRGLFSELLSLGGIKLPWHRYPF